MNQRKPQYWTIYSDLHASLEITPQLEKTISKTPSTVDGVDENDTVGNWPPTGTDPVTSRPSTFTNDDEI